MSEIKKRLKRLQKFEERVDAILLVNKGNNPNFFYLSNCDIEGFFYYDFTEAFLITSEMEAMRARKLRIKNVVTQKIEDFLREHNAKKLAIDAQNTSLAIYKRLKIKDVDISDYLSYMRSIKSKEEIKNVKAACKIASAIMKKAINEIRFSLSEWELKTIIESEMLKKGVEPSFPTIVETADNLLPHHKPTNKKLREPVLIDLGVRYKGYCSDITRTIGSDFDDVIEKVFVAVEEELKPGKKTAELDKKARAIMGRYSKYFIHNLGHGIGLEVHEKPVISQRSKDVLKPNMTFTIEPGLYLRSGIRHEEDYLLTENGFTKLS